MQIADHHVSHIKTPIRENEINNKVEAFFVVVIENEFTAPESWFCVIVSDDDDRERGKDIKAELVMLVGEEIAQHC